MHEYCIFMRVLNKLSLLAMISFRDFIFSLNENIKLNVLNFTKCSYANLCNYVNLLN